MSARVVCLKIRADRCSVRREVAQDGWCHQNLPVAIERPRYRSNLVAIGVPMNDWGRPTETWIATLNAVDRLGGYTTLESASRAGIVGCPGAVHSTWGLNMKPPAQAADVKKVETALGFSLPTALADFFLQCASEVDFLWQLPRKLPEPFEDIFSGGFSLSLQSLQDHELSRRGWIEHCFPDPDSEYDAVWHNKLAVIPIRNGDYIGIDLNDGHHGEVVYLSHDEGAGHGYVLGADFTDFLRRWAPLGCPGPEDWQWLPFVSGPTSMLEPHGAMSDQWRKTLGLTV